MIKTLFTKKGDIRWYEFFKIAIVISLFSVILSWGFDKASTINQASPIVATLIIVLLVIQLLLTSYQLIQSVVVTIKNYTIKFIEHKKRYTNFTIPYLTPTIEKEVRLPINILNIKFSVIRC